MKLHSQLTLSLSPAVAISTSHSISRRVYERTLRYENQFSSILKLELIINAKILHFDSLWKRDLGELGNSLVRDIFASNLKKTTKANNNKKKVCRTDGYSSLIFVLGQSPTEKARSLYLKKKKKKKKKKNPKHLYTFLLVVEAIFP